MSRNYDKRISCPSCRKHDNVIRIGKIYASGVWPYFECGRCHIKWAMPKKDVESILGKEA
jgi:ribosomal protein L37AE/L43A